ncbi:hypothetical protein SAMN04488121_102249 [Chitinophaga filiformis]|uniref:Uncharacterized protein n=1 Tax=Chitinophaga filiformis TaxID=104663 RepID=A0A1G7M0S5_CHIFI|nr:hypothetical protein SAMN04488121_102249 [Chitinophaga filiformis]
MIGRINVKQQTLCWRWFTVLVPNIGTLTNQLKLIFNNLLNVMP